MTMRKKDYKAIAECIKNNMFSRDSGKQMAEYFENTYPNFDRDKFLKVIL